MWRLWACALLAGATLSGGNPVQISREAIQAQTSRDRVAWVAEALQRMQTIKPGMTRAALLKVFTTEGGLFTPLQRTFVSRDCPYFKVDVEFQAVGRPDRDKDGTITQVEDGRDKILRISRPYLEFSHMD